MNLSDIDTSQYSAVLRRALIANYPRHHELDYAALFSQCRRRAGDIYLTQFVPEIGRERSVSKLRGQVLQNHISSYGATGDYQVLPRGLSG